MKITIDSEDGFAWASIRAARALIGNSQRQTAERARECDIRAAVELLRLAELHYGQGDEAIEGDITALGTD